MERRKKYPICAEDYELLEVIGDGIGTTVRRARCIPFDEVVAVKILDLERNSDLSNVYREAKTMLLIDHPNVLNAHCSFVNDHNLWVVMPYMAGGSCLHIMKLAYPTGFEEVVIATLLREVLKGLEYLHQHGHIHRDVKAGNILIDESGRVKLGDFGVSACLFDSGDRQRTRNTFVGTPCWMAPEVMEQVHGYNFKADIWSFGITALELAHGHAPFSSDPPIKVLIKTLTNAPPSLDYERDRKFSRFFRHMIASCLVKDPSKRPSAQKLLKQSFFKQAKSHDYIARKILEGLPCLSIRFDTLKQKEAELLAQDKMLDGEKEEKSQNEYKKGISSWDFNIDDLKAQASLLPENEDPLQRKDSEGCSNSRFTLDTLHENVPEGIPFVTSSSSRDNVDAANDGSVLNKGVNKHNQLHNTENCVGGICGISTGMSFRTMSIAFMPAGCMEPCNDVVIHKLNFLNCMSRVLFLERQWVVAVPYVEGLDEKPKAPLVQQKGRFKVTSENLDLDKVHPSADPPESHSVQNEQEEEIIEYIADLQQRLTSAQEELQSLRLISSAVSSPSR